MKKLLSLLLALTMILPLVGCAAFAENADPIMITVIATSDVHGKVLPINYATGEPSPNVGLSMIASMIEQVRATEENVVLVDGGDTVQGSAMTYYYSYFAPEKDDPMMKALRLMDYDMWCLGNHEFNNDLPILKRQIEYVMSPDNGEEHSVPMSAANFVAKGTEWDSWMGVPYIVKEFEGVKVGVIGMDTPNIPAWEVESHYEGIDFRNLVPTVEHFVPILREQEGCDVVIVVAHSGMGISRNYNGNVKGYFMPDRYLQTYDLVKDVKWDAKSFPLKPGITVIYLGTNDFSTGMQPAERLFVKNYITLLKEIKDNYGEDYPILCVAPKNDLLMFDYIRKALDSCGLKNVHIMALTKSVHNNDSDMGADGHPNYAGHLKKAHAMIPYVSTITGWELTGNEVK